MARNAPRGMGVGPGMTCLRHDLRMISLVLRGRVRGPEHSRLLRDMRACRACGGSAGYGEVHIAEEAPAASRRPADREHHGTALEAAPALAAQPLHPGGT